MVNWCLEGKGPLDQSPVPTKPALARGSASRKKVPPIPVSREDDSARGSYRDSVRSDQDEGQEEVSYKYLANIFEFTWLNLLTMYYT